jgi:hypothetical protein
MFTHDYDVAERDESGTESGSDAVHGSNHRDRQPHQASHRLEIVTSDFLPTLETSVNCLLPNCMVAASAKGFAGSGQNQDARVIAGGHGPQLRKALLLHFKI